MKNTEFNTLGLTPDSFELLKRSLTMQPVRHSEYNRNKLVEELKRAKILDAHELPSDVIQKYSEVVLLELKSTKAVTVTLVPPSEADLKKKRISMLSPMAIAILGYRTGAVIEWEMPNGLRKYKVVSVKQVDMESELSTA